MDNKRSEKVYDVPKAYQEKDKRSELTVYHMPESYNKVECHIQGYAGYWKEETEYHIFTHNVTHQYPSGHIVVAARRPPNNDFDKILEFDCPTDWRHPGGIQGIGDYLFVPCEKGEASIVSIYRLSGLPDRIEKVKTLEFKDHRAGCLGITDFTIREEDYYLLLIGDQYIYHAYIARIPDDISNVAFNAVGTISLDSINRQVKSKTEQAVLNCQGFGLVTDQNNQVFMVAPMSFGSGTSYQDWLFLIRIFVTAESIGYEDLSRSKAVTSTGGGSAGVHFRWGAGIQIKNGSFTVYSTRRNIVTSKLKLNFW